MGVIGTGNAGKEIVKIIDLAKPGDYVDLSLKMGMRLDLGEEEARRARKLGLKHASQYSNRNIGKRIKNVYKEILLGGN